MNVVVILRVLSVGLCVFSSLNSAAREQAKNPASGMSINFLFRDKDAIPGIIQDLSLGASSSLCGAFGCGNKQGPGTRDTNCHPVEFPPEFFSALINLRRKLDTAGKSELAICVFQMFYNSRPRPVWGKQAEKVFRRQICPWLVEEYGIARSRDEVIPGAVSVCAPFTRTQRGVLRREIELQIQRNSLISADIWIVEILGSQADRSSLLPAVLDMLSTHPDSDRGYELLTAIGIGSDDVFRALLRGVKERGSSTRAAAATALQTVRPPPVKYVSEISSLLFSLESSPGLKGYLATTLERIATPEARAAVRKYIQETKKGK